MGWGVYYPEAPEKKYQTITGKISISFNIEAELPINWDKDRIIDDIKANIKDYIQDADMNIEEIDI